MPWAASTVWKAQGGRQQWHPPSKAQFNTIRGGGRAWAPCRDMLGRDSHNPGANYSSLYPFLSFSFFFILFSLSLYYCLFHSSIASLSAAAVTHESYESLCFSLSVDMASESSVNSILPFHLLLLQFHLKASCTSSCVSSFLVPIYHPCLSFYFPILTSSFKCFFLLLFVFTLFSPSFTSIFLLLPPPLSSPALWALG